MGRKGIIEMDPEKVKAFLKAVEDGMSNKMACALSGISDSALYDWLKMAEDGNGKYADFLASYKNAKAKFVRKHVKSIEAASRNGSWQASAWMLERCCPEDYAAKSQIDASVDDRIVIVNSVPKEGQ